MIQTLRERFYWPTMWNDIKHHVSSCHDCQIRSTRKVEVPILISAPATLFHKIYLDVMYMPKAHKKSYLIAARDDLSGGAEGRAAEQAQARPYSSLVVLKRNNSSFAFSSSPPARRLQAVEVKV